MDTMTKDKLKERMVDYAKNYFNLNEIYFFTRNDKYFIELKPSGFCVEITLEECKYRAISMLESEIEGINILK